MTEHTPLAPLRDLQLSEREKQFIRTNILTWQRKWLFLRKLFFASRVTGYIAISTFGIFVLVSSYLPQPNTLNPENNSALFTLRTDDLAWTVQADTIGRLLEIQGVVHVIKDGIIVPKTDIEAGEIVVLQAGAELIVQVRAATFAKITWPAKFVLEYIPESQQTVLNLLEWNLIEVTTKITPLEPDTQDSTPLTLESPAPKENIIIKTKFVEVTPPTDQVATFVIAQEDKQAEVIAKSWNILVKKLLNENDTTPSATLMVDAGEAAHIDTQGIALYVPENEDQAVLLALESKHLQIRYETLSSIDSSTPELSVWTDEQIALLSVEDATVIVEDDVLNQLSKKTNIWTEKQILDPELLKSLTHTLDVGISTQNLEQMRKRKETNVNAYIIAYSNLMDQVNRAYTLLWATQPSTSTDSLDAGIEIAQNLLTLLETNYSTPPSLRNSLSVIISGLISLQASVPEHQAADETPSAAELWTVVASWTENEEVITSVIDEIKKISE